ncbi:DUF389 domain-containing protein [Ensifer adhaerens]|uniref:DUF389 domain-containing protein n=1 Tax=Ensifer adhaerens TaxID=106592 RepID=UPI003D05E77A
MADERNVSSRVERTLSNRHSEHLTAVREEIKGNARVTAGYLFMNAAATWIAAFGLFQNSPAVIIGAMLIAMLMGPILGIALSLAEADVAGFWRAFRGELIGVLWVLAFASVAGYVFRSLPIGSEILGRTQPTILDLCIALAGGAAAGFASVSKRVSGAMVGIAISTALVPPLTSCALLLVRGLTGPALGAFLNFLTNFVAIALAAMVVFVVAGFRPRAQFAGRRLGAVMIGLIYLAIGGVLVSYLYGTFKTTFGREQLRVSVHQTLTDLLKPYPGTRLVSVSIEPGDGRPRAWIVVRTRKAVTPEQAGQLRQALIRTVGQDLDLHIRSVIAVEATPEGYLEPVLPGYDDPE